MNTEIVKEKRPVSGFDRVSLTGFGELVITQGEEETLSIEGAQSTIDRIETQVQDGRLIISVSKEWWDWIDDLFNFGFSGVRVKYHLQVRELTGLAILGAGRVEINGLHTDCLALRLAGAGEVKVKALDADRLEVELPGAGRISVTGRAEEQSVTLSGAGSYDAPRLESRRVTARLTGLGSATVWATDELDAAIRGVGAVSYHGHPTVRKEIAGPGSVSALNGK